MAYVKDFIEFNVNHGNQVENVKEKIVNFYIKF